MSNGYVLYKDYAMKNHEARLRDWLVIGIIVFILGLVIAIMVHRASAAPVPLPKEVKKLTDKDVIGAYSGKFQGCDFSFSLHPDRVFTCVYANLWWTGNWKYKEPYIIVEEWESNSRTYGQPHTAVRWYIMVSKDKSNKVIKYNRECIVGRPPRNPNSAK